jgi:phosphoglycerol transferase MdoB-like AlkP superfamily enzyme
VRGLPGGRPGRLAWAERHLTWLYWACAVVLTPWVVFLYMTQVRRAEAHQIGPLAAGLILAMMVGILLTAWTYRRGSPRSVMAASFTAATTFISAWFRALTRTGGTHWAGPVPIVLAVVAVVIIVGLCVFVIQCGFSDRPPPPARWLPIVLVVAALALVPTLVVVLTVVPAAQTAHHLKIAWTGLDVFEVMALAATGLALQRRSALTAVPATITGTLLVCDAWINIVPVTGAAFYEAIAMAFVELPLAGLSFWVATRRPGPAWSGRARLTGTAPAESA